MIKVNDLVDVSVADEVRDLLPIIPDNGAKGETIEEEDDDDSELRGRTTTRIIVVMRS